MRDMPQEELDLWMAFVNGEAEVKKEIMERQRRQSQTRYTR